MKQFFKDYGFGLFVAVFIVANICVLSYKIIVQDPRDEAQRQQQIDTFYRTHNCRPEGYMPTKYEPERTYRCDNGLFIVRDMK